MVAFTFSRAAVNNLTPSWSFKTMAVPLLVPKEQRRTKKNKEEQRRTKKGEFDTTNGTTNDTQEETVFLPST